MAALFSQHKLELEKKNVIIIIIIIIIIIKTSGCCSLPPGGGGGGGVLPIFDYTGRLRPKGVPFSGWRYIEG